MKYLLLNFLRLIWIVVLTVLTQVGGLIYLFYLIIGRWIPWSRHPWTKRLQRAGFFLGFYFLVSLVIIPLLSDRSSLPWRGDIRPATYWTCIMNRHYVDPGVLEVLESVHPNLTQEFPDFQIVYLDGNFPFWDGFPLVPHLSHDDGRKLDLTFVYEQNGRIKPVSPGRIFGYGKGELPKAQENDQAKICRSQGYWPYDRVDWVSPSWLETRATINAPATSALIASLAREKRVEKIFLEPHLQQRWGVGTYQKVRFQGCHSVKHDDHIHFQIR